jgi:hypothetical protein
MGSSEAATKFAALAVQEMGAPFMSSDTLEQMSPAAPTAEISIPNLIEPGEDPDDGERSIAPVAGVPTLNTSLTGYDDGAYLSPRVVSGTESPRRRSLMVGSRRNESHSPTNVRSCVPSVV